MTANQQACGIDRDSITLVAFQRPNSIDNLAGSRTERLASLVGVSRLIPGIIGGAVIAAESWEQCGAADLIVSTYWTEKEAIMIQSHHEGA